MKQQSKQKDELANDIIKRLEFLEGDRLVSESHWQEIAERMLPSQSRYFSNQRSYTQGDKRNEFIFDSTAQIALGRFASIVDSLLTPRNQTWHRLLASDPYLNKDRATKLYFEEVNRLLFKHRYAPQANFASQNQQNYLSVGAYGTGCMYVDNLANGAGLRYRAVHLAEIYFAENHQGMVDSAYRVFRLTARQARQMFGEENLPDKIVSALSSNPDNKFEFVHCVKPNEEIEYDKSDYRGMEYASYYIAREEKMIVKDKEGFSTFPYAISRYEQAPGEVYGRSPAMNVLPAVKTLNEEKKTILKQGHRAVDPILLAHDDGIVDGFSFKPGAINVGGVSAEGRMLVHPLPVGNMSIGKDLMDDERAVINDAFLVTLFQILVETPQMTATEVMERTREKGILLAPTIGRLQSEYLGPMVDRELDLLSRQGLLPPMPPALREAKGDYRLEYDSPLSRAQRAEEASGLMRTIESVLNIVNVTQNPAPLDHFNWDVIVPEISEIQAVPSRWMNSLEAVQQMRQSRADQAQEQTAIQAAPGAAALIKSSAVARKSAG